MRTNRSMRRMTGLLCVAMAMGLCACNGQLATGKPTDQTQWRPLFDGKTLTGWKAPEWGGSGKVGVVNGEIHIAMGDSCTGITYVDANSLPREDYELALEAMRVEGGDFFCGLTFPVGKDAITFVMGGWAGWVSGMSCINGRDASENETTHMIEYKNKQWYRVRVRVTKTHLLAWVDDKLVVWVERKGKEISVRSEMDLSVPLGVATWRTHGAICNVRIRRLGEFERVEVPERPAE